MTTYSGYVELRRRFKKILSPSLKKQLTYGLEGRGGINLLFVRTNKSSYPVILDDYFLDLFNPTEEELIMLKLDHPLLDELKLW